MRWSQGIPFGFPFRWLMFCLKTIARLVLSHYQKQFDILSCAMCWEWSHTISVPFAWLWSRAGGPPFSEIMFKQRLKKHTQL